MMSHISSPKISQYHHFVPRFILRNFAHPFKPPIAPSKGSGKRNKRKKRDGHRPGEPMLNVIKLDGATAQIVETPVAKTLGIEDMYRDLRGAANQNHLEEELSKLESRAAMVIRKMLKAFEAGDKDVWITRAERDILRKFLFIMKYRSSGFHKRYSHHDAEHYSENDKDRLSEYMRKKGYEKPVDVWFDNIKAMLELKMDPQMKWMVWLREHVYPDDAMWFIAHCQKMYLALCTPSGSVDEFLLAENAYGIHEGPVSCYVDPKTMKMTEGSYTEFHVFAPISPRLMLVLRSFLLPVPEEDAHEETRVWRQSRFEQSAAQHNDPLRVRSIIEDLPIHKARNSYTKIVDGKVVLLEGEDGSLRADHKFCFRFFPISVDHTNRINFIMLEHGYHISTIVYKSQPAAFRTLRVYLTMPCELNGSAFKVIDDPDDDQRMSFLKKLEKLVGDLGSKGMSTYQPRIKECDDKLGMLGQMLGKSHLSAQDDPTDFMQLYGKLGLSHILSEANTVSNSCVRWNPYYAPQRHGSSS